MLKQHINDPEEVFDNKELIQRKQAEIKKLSTKKANLLEMREDGDIDKEYFKVRRKELDDKIAVLTVDVRKLELAPVKNTANDLSSRLMVLKKKLEEYTSFTEPVIPESVVEAFIEKIWVSKDEFRWYLRTGHTSPDDEREHIKIGAFTLTLDDAKAYQYSFSTKKRIYNWVDLNISVWL